LPVNVTGRRLTFTRPAQRTPLSVCVAHKQIFFFEARYFVDATGVSAEDTVLCSIHLHHSYGLGNCLLDASYFGATLVFEPDVSATFVARHEAMLKLLRKEWVGIYPGMPFQ
jgi:hypothetical protein